MPNPTTNDTEELRDEIALDMFGLKYTEATDNQKHRVKKLLKIFTQYSQQRELASLEKIYSHDPEFIVAELEDRLRFLQSPKEKTE